MGISSVFSSFVKGVTWTKVATMAMEYAPELYRKAMERYHGGTSAAAMAEEAELKERLERLEKLLLEQDGVIREQTAKNALLEKKCQGLEQSLLALKICAGVLTLCCIILLAIIFR